MLFIYVSILAAFIFTLLFSLHLRSPCSVFPLYPCEWSVNMQRRSAPAAASPARESESLLVPALLSLRARVGVQGRWRRAKGVLEPPRSKSSQ
jgi:hypothetical protein